MPNPSKDLHMGVGLWPKADIPTESQYRVLCHLASDPMSRLYIQPSGALGGIGSVSNANGVPGWTSKGFVFGLIATSFDNKGPWVTLDEAATKRAARGIRVYFINDKGIEAIAQYDARFRYEKEHLELARKILKECRKAAKALRAT